MIYLPMKIKPKSRRDKKTREYLKWMGLLPPKSKGRLKQLNKFNRKHRVKSELVVRSEAIESQYAVA